MLFLSSFTKKIDKKGRVSVPSQFRAVLAAESFGGIVVYPAFTKPCLEACGMARIEALSERIDTLDPFSEEHDAFATAILGAAVQLPFDGEGRVALPPEMIASVGIGEDLVFVGKGKTFELWEPAGFEKHAVAARKLALENRAQLRAGQ